MKMSPMMMMVAATIFISSLAFTIVGVNMHAQVNVLEEEFHANQEDYFTLDKQTRDAATTGSELSAQLVEIQQTPSELLRLKLVGVGKILTGIYILLFGILIALLMMPIRLAQLINKKH